MFQSIRWRLVSSYVLLAIVTAALVGLLALEVTRRAASNRELAELKASAEAIARQASPLMGTQKHALELSQLVRASAFLGNVRVRILDTEKKTLIDSGIPGEWNEFVWVSSPLVSSQPTTEANPQGVAIPLDPNLPQGQRPTWEENLPPGSSTTRIRRSIGPWGGRISFDQTAASDKLSADAQTSGNQARSEVVVTVLIGKTDSQLGYVELSSGPNYTAEALDTSRQGFIVAGIGAVLLATVIGLFIGSRLAMPLHQLSDTAAQMGSGNLAVRSAITSKDEIGQLASRFNQMAESLQSSFHQLGEERDALRRFIADSSHELRTPITALKNFNELLQGPAREDAQAQVEFLAESQIQIDRLEWITQNLLNLSRIDAGLVTLDRMDQDISDLLLEASAPFKALAADKGISLDTYLPKPSFLVNCDRARIELALSNLIDNAIKYSISGGMVRVSASLEKGKVWLWVEDEGPGILDEDKDHIFERFYRGRNASGAGSGLGLSIAASIIQAHNGKIWVENRPALGAKFIIEL